MSKPLVTYNSRTGELRSNPEAFAEKSEYVASIVWKTEVGQVVSQGDTIATIQWGNGMRGPLDLPEGCNGEIKFLNRNVKYEDLEYMPSQLLARIS